MLSDDILYLSVWELGARIAARWISPIELTEAYLERLERIGPKLGAVATVTRELAMEQARAAEQEIAAGHSRGPLHGIPYGAKDLLATRGIPTAWGAPPFKKQVFDYDATVIRKLREAGAVLVAKLAMIELAGGGGYNSASASLQGATRNPFNTGYWAGGSSSGPAAAVAAGLVGFAIGSETLGSIVTPAAFCAVSGLRTTYGRVSRHGAMPLSWTMDKLGPMCRTAVDCGLVLNAIAGEDSLDAASRREPLYWWPPNDEKRARSLAGKRLGVLRPDFKTAGNADVGANFDAALEVLRKIGARVEETSLPEFPYAAVAETIYSAEMASVFRPFVESGQVDGLLDDSQKAGLVAAQSLRATDYLDACRLRTEIQSEMANLFEKYDALAAPSRTSTAPAVDRDFEAAPETPDRANLIAGSNIAGLPAISVPCGFTREKNLPIGIQFVCDALREDACIECAHAYQLATDWHTRRPKLQ
ncbi:MAG: amidase [Candidatus Acidiferrales bacterium]|jgi:aspartyl-tRNA(Asn)/glutamyl-tRNA(Gln) amidotransferase subunit A